MIRTRTVRMILGTTILISHFGGMAFYIIFATSFLDWNGVLQGVLSLAPITSVYAVLFVKYCGHASTSLESEKPENDPGYDISAFFGLSLPVVLFLLALFGGLFIIFNFDTSMMPAFTGGLDTIFGAFLATVFSSLFPDELFQEKRSRGVPSRRSE
ncbi:MAG: hypothetical protein KC587_16340 [Nitrospira sp.]|nr:hypothetical protein [Nitrospira sp.]